MDKTPITKKLLVTLMTPDGEILLYDGTGTLPRYSPELETWTGFQKWLGKLLDEGFEKVSYASISDDYTVVVYLKK